MLAYGESIQGVKVSGFRAKRRLGELSRGLFRRILLLLEQATVETRASFASRPQT